ASRPAAARPRRPHPRRGGVGELPRPRQGGVAAPGWRRRGRGRPARRCRPGAGFDPGDAPGGGRTGPLPVACRVPSSPAPPMSRMQFELLATDGAARRARLAFPRGTVETPAFMPVGTYGTVKGMLPEQVRATGAQIILGNT